MLTVQTQFTAIFSIATVKKNMQNFCLLVREESKKFVTDQGLKIKRIKGYEKVILEGMILHVF